MVRKSIRALVRNIGIGATAATCLAIASPAAAAFPGAPKFDGADTAWLLLCATLVLMMTIPGLALFYGGMVRRKNVLSTLMQSFILVESCRFNGCCSVTASLSCRAVPSSARSRGRGSLASVRRSRMPLIRDRAASGVHDLPVHVRRYHARADYRRDRGADVVQRLPGFHRHLVMFIYNPLAHWVWGVGGWIHQLGALDSPAERSFTFPRASPHSSPPSWSAAERLSHEPMPPHNVILTVTGAGLLWVGWFGFNAGAHSPPMASLCRHSSRRISARPPRR